VRYARALIAWFGCGAHSLYVLSLPPWKRTDARLDRAFPDLTRLSFLLGLIQILGGVAIYGFGLVSYMYGFADQSASVFWEQAQTGQSVTDTEHIAFNLSGLIGFVSYMFTPTAWLGLYVIGEGVLRFAAYFTQLEMIGTPIGYPIAWALDRVTASTKRRMRHHRQGEEVADRIEWNRTDDRSWALQVVSARDKPWREEIAIEIGDDFYRLIEVTERRDGGRLRVCYRLAPWPVTDIVLPSEPPAPAPADGAAAGKIGVPPVRDRWGNAAR